MNIKTMLGIGSALLISGGFNLYALDLNQTQVQFAHNQTPIQIENVQQLGFGLVNSTYAGGTAVLNTNGSVAYTGGVSGAGTGTTGMFYLTGDTHAGVQVTVPTSFELTGVNNLVPMVVTPVNHYGGVAVPNVYSTNFGSLGHTNNFTVSGTLSVPADLVNDTFTGTCVVTAAYL